MGDFDGVQCGAYSQLIASSEETDCMAVNTDVSDINGVASIG